SQNPGPHRRHFPDCQSSRYHCQQTRQRTPEGSNRVATAGEFQVGVRETPPAFTPVRRGGRFKKIEPQIEFMKPVAIIGAGITGLTAAFYLKRKGVPVTVFEAGERVGGVIQSLRQDGYLAE